MSATELQDIRIRTLIAVSFEYTWSQPVVGVLACSLPAELVPLCQEPDPRQIQ